VLIQNQCIILFKGQTISTNSYIASLLHCIVTPPSYLTGRGPQAITR